MTLRERVAHNAIYLKRFKGVTNKHFASANGLSATTLGTWIKQFKESYPDWKDRTTDHCAEYATKDETIITINREADAQSPETPA